MSPSPSVTSTPTRPPIFPENAASLEQIYRIWNGTIEDIASAGLNENVIKLWDAETGKLSYLLEGSRHSIYSLAFSPQGRRLASGCFGNVLVWVVDSGELKYTLSDFIGDGYIQFSQDGHLVIVTGLVEDTARIIRVDTGEILADLPLPQGCMDFSFTPDERYLVFSCSDCTVRVYGARR